MAIDPRDLEKALQPKAPAILLFFGSVLWKGFSWWSNVDFILSMREERIAMLFQVLLNWGWLVIVVGAVIWALVSKDTRTAFGGGGLSLSVGLLSFMFGVLVATYATQSVPAVITAWGDDPVNKNCYETIDTSRLVGFQANFRIATVCGVRDPSIDQMEDGRISISSTFRISGGPVDITIPYSDAFSQAVTSGKFKGIWHAVILVQSDEEMNRIKRLSDVLKDRGKVIVNNTIVQ